MLKKKYRIVILLFLSGLCAAVLQSCIAPAGRTVRNQPGSTTGKSRHPGEISKQTIVSREQCSLHLEPWTIEKIDHMLAEAAKIESPGQRMKFIVYHFLGTPFQPEPTLEAPGRNVLPIHFGTFDCITFGLYMLALNLSGNFDEFMNNLARLRYKDPEKSGIDNDLEKGNILDFTYEILLVNAVSRGFVKDITGEILSRNKIAAGTITRSLEAVERRPDMGGGIVFPRYSTQEITVSYIHTYDVADIEQDIQTGDIILFVVADKPGRPKVFFAHFAVALQGCDLPPQLREKNGIPADDKHIYFAHSSLSRGINGERLGVCICGQETFLDSLIYDIEKPRLLSHYCFGVGWLGIVVLRQSAGNI